MLNKKFLNSFIKSTCIVLFISTLIGLASIALNGSFLAIFILSVCIQYILFSFVASIINNYFIQQAKIKELDKLEPLSTLLQCSYCQRKNIITFLPDQTERVEFECDSCKKKNLVTIGFTVAQITEPVSVMPVLPQQTENE
jgi:hypothetical protein